MYQFQSSTLKINATSSLPMSTIQQICITSSHSPLCSHHLQSTTMTTASCSSTVESTIHNIEIVSLSDQLLLKIFRFLDGKDIVRLTGVCKRFRAFVDSNRDQLQKVFYLFNLYVRSTVYSLQIIYFNLFLD